MIGTTKLEKLEITCIVGILPFERVTEQTIFVDVAMDLDFGPASESEDISDTVDYTTVAQELTALVRQRRFQLIETMAVECADLVLANHSQVERVAIAIHKPAAVPQAQDTVVHYGRPR